MLGREEQDSLISSINSTHGRESNEVPSFSSDGQASANRSSSFAESRDAIDQGSSYKSGIGVTSSTKEFVPNSKHHNTRYWTPLPLKAATLIAFIALYAAILASLETVYQVDGKHHGLSTASTSSRYLWTYGPTAVFTLVAAFWGPVEYRTKQLMPWKILQKGPQKAEETLLLDYVSPWNVKALFVSLRKAHWPVSLAIASSLLIKALIVASTGLLVLQGTPINRMVSLHTTNKFDGRHFNDSIVDMAPALAVIGTQSLGLELPAGTTAMNAVQSFNVSNTDHPTNSDATLTSSIDVFSADLDCEDARITHSYPYCHRSHCPTVFYSLDVESDTCKVNQTGALEFTLPVSLNPQTFGYLIPSKCNNTGSDESLRYMIITGARIPTKQPAGGFWTANDTSHRGLTGNFTALLCKPTYQIRERSVSLNLNGTVNSTLAHQDVSASRTLPNVTPEAIGAAFLSSLGAAASPISNFNASLSVQLGGSQRQLLPNNATFSGWNWSTTNLQNYGEYYDTFFILLNATTPVSDPAALTDKDILMSTSQSVFNLMAAQIASRYLLIPDRAPLMGVLNTVEQRLHVRLLALRLMEAALIALIIFTALLLWVRPTEVAPRDTSSLAGVATVLAQSPNVNHVFRNLGSSSLQSLRSALSGHQFQTTPKSRRDQVVSFHIEAPSFKPGDGGAETPIAHRLWRPFALSWPMKIAILAFPLAVVCTLEAVYQHSRKNDGLGTVQSDSNIRYAWAFVPAFVMLVVRTLFDLVDYSTRLIAPYWQLKKEPAPTHRSLDLNYMAALTAVSLVKSASNKHFAVTASTVTMFMAPFLAIVVSSLYFPQPITIHESAMVSYQTVMNKSFHGLDVTKDSQTLLLANLVTKTGFPYPRWTHDELVIPVLNMTSVKLLREEQNQSVSEANVIRLRMPVLRSNLNCTGPYRTYTISNTADQKGYYLQWATADVPSHCIVQGRVRNTTQWQMSEQANATYYGEINDMPFSWAAYQSESCPAKAGIYGKPAPGAWRGKNQSTYEWTFDGMNAFFCYPSMSELQADISFSLPDFSIISATPDESTSTRLLGVNSTFAVDYLYGGETNQGGASLDGFMRAVADQQDPEALFGKDSWPKMNAAMERLYRLTWAQRMNLGARISPNSSQPALNATVQYPSTYRARLMQDATSTRVLEALLLTMFVCAATAFWLLHSRVLPAEPSSIAAMIALLADSELTAESIRPGGLEHDKKNLFDGYLFSLGWWHRKSDGSRRFGIDIGKADAQPIELKEL